MGGGGPLRNVWAISDQKGLGGTESICLLHHINQPPLSTEPSLPNLNMQQEHFEKINPILGGKWSFNSSSLSKLSLSTGNWNACIFFPSLAPWLQFPPSPSQILVCKPLRAGINPFVLCKAPCTMVVPYRTYFCKKNLVDTSAFKKNGIGLQWKGSVYCQVGPIMIVILNFSICPRQQTDRLVCCCI